MLPGKMWTDVLANWQLQVKIFGYFVYCFLIIFYWIILFFFGTILFMRWHIGIWMQIPKHQSTFCFFCFFLFFFFNFTGVFPTPTAKFYFGPETASAMATGRWEDGEHMMRLKKATPTSVYNNLKWCTVGVLNTHTHTQACVCVRAWTLALLLLMYL